jgi:hypothetical protein
MAVVLPFVATFVDKGAKAAIAAIKEVDQTWGSFGSGLKSAAGPAAAVGTALVGGLLAAKNAAGDASKSQKVLKSAMANAGYEENAKAVGDYATELSKTTGIDANQIRMAQARLATNKDLAGSTENMAKVTMLAADMSAQGMGSMESASATLTKALNDPVKGMAMLARAGIVFDETTKKSVKSAVESGDKLAAQQMVLAAVQATVGGAAEDTAGSTAKMRATYAELLVIIGESLLPAFTKLAEVLKTVLTWMTENIGVTKLVIGVVTGLVSAILLLNAAMKIQEILSKLFGIGKAKEAAATTASTAATVTNTAAERTNTAAKRGGIGALLTSVGTWIKNTAQVVINTASLIAHRVATLAMTAAQKIAKVATAAWTVAQKLLNAALKANPIGLVITAVMLLVGALKYAWENSETFRRIVTTAFNAVKDVAQRVFGAIKGFIQPVIDALQRIIGLAQDVAGAISGVINKLPSLRGAQEEAAAGLPGPTATGRAGGSGTGVAGAPVYITVTGALDPERVGRQIRDILDGHDIRQGRMVTRAVAW